MENVAIVSDDRDKLTKKIFERVNPKTGAPLTGYSKIGD